jgi:hypothetical protein
MTTRKIILGAVLTAVTILVAAEPGQISSLPTLCFFRLVFGWECPGCGMLRGLAALGSADLDAAVSYNWKVVLTGPLLAYLLVRECLRAATEYRE